MSVKTKRISVKDLIECEKMIIYVKSLNDAQLIIDADDGITVSAHAKFNNHRLHITYYRELPKYSDDDMVRVTKRVLIHNWWYLNDQNKMLAYELERKVSNEIINIFDELLDID